jgi:hypothetical protein
MQREGATLSPMIALLRRFVFVTILVAVAMFVETTVDLLECMAEIVFHGSGQFRWNDWFLVPLTFCVIAITLAFSRQFEERVLKTLDVKFGTTIIALIIAALALGAINIHACRMEDTKATSNTDANGHAGSSDQKSDRWSRADKLTLAYDILTGILVLAGIAGVSYGVRTLRAIEKQGRLMEVPYRQWIELAGWNAKKVPWDAKPRRNLEHDPAMERLRITVNVVNPTSYPITIKEGSIRFGQPHRVVYHFGENTFLVTKPPYTIDVDLHITQEEATAFENGSLVVAVAARFRHVGPLGESTVVNQSLEGFIHCGHWGTAFNPRIQMNPIAENQKTEA